MMRQRVTVVSVVVCLFAVSGALFAQDYDWQVWAVDDGGNGHEYAVIIQPADWATQKDVAEAAGGYLATLLSAEEEAFVSAVITKAEQEHGENTYYWMGLFQDPQAQEPKYGWQWVTGEALGYDGSTWALYANWGLGEPNDQGNEDYGAIRRNNGGGWLDAKGGTALRAVIEREPNSPPVADAGEDQVVQATGPEGAEVTLDGSGSSDADQDPLTYAWSWGDNGEATGETPTVVLPLGETEVTLVVNDGKADSEPDIVLVTVQDSTPPVTFIEPDRDPDEAGIYTSAVSVTITATDGASGVAWTKYRVVEGSAEAAGDWLEYTGPLTFDETGCYTVQAYSQDNAGNEEDPPASLQVIVDLGNSADTTPPVVTLNQPRPSTLWPPRFRKVRVRVSGSAVDDVGVARAWLVVDDEYRRRDRTYDVTRLLDEQGNFTKVIKLRALCRLRDRDGRHYVITLHAVDEAGNEAEPVSVTVVAPHICRWWRHH